MSKKVIVVGGGIIGLCSAYYLHKAGQQVSVYDKSNMDSGASYVNAGYLSPSHIIPLAAPGVMKKGLKWMFNRSSPLYIKPRFEADLFRWAWAFNKSCNPQHVEKAIPVIKDIALHSQELYDAIKEEESFRFHYDKKGLFMLCNTEKGLKEEIDIAERAKAEGLDVDILSHTDLKQLEPVPEIAAIGATYYKCDFHTTPHEFMEDMKVYLKKEGVPIFSNVEIRDFEVRSNQILSLQTDKEVLTADEYVFAAGSWTGRFIKKLGLRLLLQAGKGYRINSNRPFGISIPAILSEAKVAITPMNGFTRFAGTMEIAGINHDINKVRVEAIARATQTYYPEVRLNTEEKTAAACGLRPVSPDGLPYIGRTEKCSNVVIATGHAMMGWSMATATGNLVAEVISEKNASMDMTPFSPDRRF